MELRGQQGELSRPTAPHQLQTPDRKRPTFQVDTTLVVALLPQAEEGFPPTLATAQPKREPHHRANEEPVSFELPVDANRLFVHITALPTYPFPFTHYPKSLFLCSPGLPMALP